MDIFRRLRQDHARQRELANRILETAAGDRKRETLYRRFKREVESHTRAETQVLYAVAQQLQGCHLQVRRGLFAHGEIARQIERLDASDPAADEWLPRFVELREDMETYTCEEEEFLFPVAAECLHPATASLMAHDYAARKAKSAATRRAPRAAMLFGTPDGEAEMAAH